MSAARELFDACKNSAERIRALKERREWYMDMATQATARPHMTGGGKGGKKVEDGAIRLAALAEECDREITELARLTREAKALIRALPDQRQRDVLTWRYLNAWGWRKVARAMHCDRSSAFRIHDRAIEAAEQLLEKDATKCDC